jgi:hypothetical protein
VSLIAVNLHSNHLTLFFSVFLKVMLHKIAEFDRDLHTQNVVTKEINELQFFSVLDYIKVL